MGDFSEVTWDWVQISIVTTLLSQLVPAWMVALLTWPQQPLPVFSSPAWVLLFPSVWMVCWYSASIVALQSKNYRLQNEISINQMRWFLLRGFLDNGVGGLCPPEKATLVCGTMWCLRWNMGWIYMIHHHFPTSWLNNKLIFAFPQSTHSMLTLTFHVSNFRTVILLDLLNVTRFCFWTEWNFIWLYLNMTFLVDLSLFSVPS